MAGNRRANAHRGRLAARPVASAALAATLAALLVAGCGGSSSDRRSQRGAKSTPAASPSAAGRAGAGGAAAGDADWPFLGRDRDNTRFVARSAITPATVHRLGVAWSQDLGAYQSLMESFPLVVGDTMYVTSSTDESLALDARTGRIRWKYAPQVDFSLSTGVGGYGVTVNRGVAVSNGRVYALTFDDRLKAVSQSTGEELWSSRVADPHTSTYETMAPTVWHGLVFVGSSGAEQGVRGFVAAYDAKTGKQVWRFWTVPAPGHGWVKPGNNGGGTTYMAPTIDPRTGLLYVGTGNPSPAIVGVSRPGPDLYTDSILALHATSGKLAWYHQEVPHDLWDYDAESPVVAFDTRVHGRTVHAVAEAGKSGYLFVLDAATGKDLFRRVAFVKEDHRPPTRKGVLEWPGPLGGSQYSPLAYSPLTHALYVSGLELPFVLQVTSKPVGGEKAFGGLRSSPGDIPPRGTFSAVDTTSGRFMWRRQMPTPMIGGATVVGDLVFTGDQHGYLYAMDARTGRTVWKVGLGLAIATAPIVYTIDGRDYLAVTVGGSALTASKHLGPIGARVVTLTLDGRKVPSAWQSTSARWARQGSG